MKDNIIYKDPIKWSDLFFSIIVMIVLSLFLKVKFWNSIVLISIYPTLFLILTKRYLFCESFFIQKGILFNKVKQFPYADLLKCTIQNQIYARKTISFYFGNNKRINVHYSEENMSELILKLKENGIKIIDNSL